MTHRDSREELMGKIRSLVKTEARSSKPGMGARVLSHGEMNTTDQILFRLQQHVPNGASHIGEVSEEQKVWALRVELEACIAASEKVGEVNPRPPGFLNERLQSAKRLMRRSLSWYTRPLRVFHGAVIQTLQQCLAILEKHQAMLDDRRLETAPIVGGVRLDDVEEGIWRIYRLTRSATEDSEAQFETISGELNELRDQVRELRAEVASDRRQPGNAPVGHRAEEQPCSGGNPIVVDFPQAGSTSGEKDYA
jgi:hypothetical protein